MNSWLHRLVDLVFGYDFFVSYAWADASSYADQLAAVLSDQGFVAFIDKREYSAGDDLKRSAQRALRKSGFLVVILSNAALESRDVLEEVETFKPSGRKILVLDTERLREENLDNPLVQAIGPDTLDIRGDVGSLRAGPSSHAVGEIARSYDLTRQSQRRLRWIASIAALLFVLAASAGFLGLMADQGRKEAIRQENLAKQQRDVAISKQLAVRANRNLEENLDLALILSVQGVQIDDNWETRDSLLSALQKAQGVRAFLHPQGDIAFSPNGRFLAYQADKHITRVYDTDSGSLRTLRLDSPEARRLIAISPDGSLVVTWRDSVLEVWQVPTGNLVKRVEFGELPLRCPVAEVGLPLTKALVKVTKKIEKLLRRRIADKDSSPTPVEHFSYIPVMEWKDSHEPEEQFIFRGFVDDILCLPSLDGRQIICNLPKSNASPDTKSSGDVTEAMSRLLSDQYDSRAGVLDSRSCKVSCAIDSINVWKGNVAFSRDRGLVVGTISDGSPVLWDTRQCKPLALPLRSSDSIACASFNPTASELAIATLANEIVVIELSTSREIKRWRSGDSSQIRKMEFGPKGDVLITVGQANNKVTLWDVGQPTGAGGLLLFKSQDPQDPLINPSRIADVIDEELSWLQMMEVRPLVQLNSAFGGKGDLWAFVAEPRIVLVFNLKQRQLVDRLVFPSPPLALAFDSENRLLAPLASGDFTRTTFSDVQSKTQTVGHLETRLRSAALSSDGTTLAAVREANDRRVMIFQARDNFARQVQEISLESRPCILALSSAGSVMVAATCPQAVDPRSILANEIDRVKVWDVARAMLLAEAVPAAMLQGEIGIPPWSQTSEHITSIALSYEGRSLAVAGSYGRVALFDLAGLSPLGDPLFDGMLQTDFEEMLRGQGKYTQELDRLLQTVRLVNRAPAGNLAFSPDGRKLAATIGHAIRVWDVDIGSWKRKACQIANRNLNLEEWKRYVGEAIPYRRTCPDLADTDLDSQQPAKEAK